MAPAEEKFYQARIVERQDLSEDLWTIRVDPGGEFHFHAGQYATLGIVTPEKHIERPYSIVSAPFEPHLEFFLERVPQGALTPMLFKRQVGDTLTIRKTAKGRFTLDTASGRKNHLLICTVTGVAPFVSYIRTLYRDWKQHRETDCGNPATNFSSSKAPAAPGNSAIARKSSAAPPKSPGSNTSPPSAAPGRIPTGKASSAASTNSSANMPTSGDLRPKTPPPIFAAIPP